MHAIILAGGEGTRLRPLTYAVRKELVPVVNTPLLEYRLRNLAQHDILDVVIACSADARDIEGHFGDGSSLGLRVQYSYEVKRLGSGRAVKEAARAAGASGTLVVCNGDIITNVDLTSMIERHRDTNATLSMSLAPVHDPWHYGVAQVDQDLRIRTFVEKPPQGNEPSNLINAGTWIWEPEILDMIPDDDSAVMDGFSERVLFPGIIADGLRLQGFTEDLWVDVGSPERYLIATRLLLERMSAETGADILEVGQSDIADSAVVDGLVAVGHGSRIGERARIIGPVVLGPGAAVGDGAVVEGSSLWDRSSVGSGGRVTGSIVAFDVHVGAEAVVDGAVLANGVRIEDGRTLQPGARIMPGERA
jgi:mannose-1-phosphate guanylyltransferase